MKEIMKWIAKVLFFAFACAVIGYTSYMTFKLADRLVPGNIILQLLTVVFFDGAALVWFLNFLFGSEGIGQWGISLLCWVVGLLGAFAMTGAELIFSQKLVIVEDPERYGWAVIIAVAVACLLNVFFAYLYHLVAPKSWRQINSSIELAKMEDRAFSNALDETKRRLDEVIVPLTDTFLDMLNAGVQEKSLYFRREYTKQQAQKGQAIEGKIRDTEMQPISAATQPKKHKRGLFDLFNRSHSDQPVVTPALTNEQMAQMAAWYEEMKAARAAQPAEVKASETVAPPTLEPTKAETDPTTPLTK